jgi:hypothetical protein
MRVFLKTVVGIFAIISLIALMILSTATFLFLDPNFYITSLAKPGVYANIQKGLKTSARESLREQFSKQGVAYEDLSVGQRQLVDDQIDKILFPINEANVRDLSEKNIVNFFDYVNGNSERLTVYLPLDKWGLSSEAAQQIPDYLKTTNIDILKISQENPQANINSKQIIALHNLGGKIRLYWLVALGLTIFLFLIHLILGDSQFRFVKSGRLVTGGGITILFLAWVIKIFQNTFGQNIAVRSEAIDILAGTILSALLENVYRFWIISAVVFIIFGLLMFNIKRNKAKNTL